MLWPRGDRARLAELADVRARDEAAARADQHHRADVGIGVALLDGLDDAFAHAGSERVHRRIVDRDHADAVLDFESHHLGFTHFDLLSNLMSCGPAKHRPDWSRCIRLMPRLQGADSPFAMTRDDACMMTQRDSVPRLPGTRHGLCPKLAVLGGTAAFLNP